MVSENDIGVDGEVLNESVFDPDDLVEVDENEGVPSNVNDDDTGEEIEDDAETSSDHTEDGSSADTVTSGGIALSEEYYDEYDYDED